MAGEGVECPEVVFRRPAILLVRLCTWKIFAVVAWGGGGGIVSARGVGGFVGGGPIPSLHSEIMHDLGDAFGFPPKSVQVFLPWHIFDATRYPLHDGVARCGEGPGFFLREEGKEEVVEDMIWDFGNTWWGLRYGALMGGEWLWWCPRPWPPTPGF